MITTIKSIDPLPPPTVSVSVGIKGPIIFLNGYFRAKRERGTKWRDGIKSGFSEYFLFYIFDTTL